MSAVRPHWGDDFSDQAIGWHLADLAAFACPVCLITDTAMAERDAAGRETERIDLMRGRWTPRAADAQWDWLVAPQGEAARGGVCLHTVQAWRDVRPVLG
jgi:hypothetical protein